MPGPPSAYLADGCPHRGSINVHKSMLYTTEARLRVEVQFRRRRKLHLAEPRRPSHILAEMPFPVHIRTLTLQVCAAVGRNRQRAFDSINASALASAARCGIPPLRAAGWKFFPVRLLGHICTVPDAIVAYGNDNRLRRRDRSLAHHQTLPPLDVTCLPRLLLGAQAPEIGASHLHW